MQSSVNLADTASLLTEVTNVFNPGDDMQLAEKFAATDTAIQRACAEKKEEMNNILQGATEPLPY